MAIFAPDISTVTRGGGASPVASSAYMSRSDMTLERTGERWDYSRVHPHEELVRDYGVTVPEEAPERFRDRSLLWNEVEAVETRSNAQLYERVMIPLPDELDDAQTDALAREIIDDRVADGRIVDACLHRNVDGTNTHLHMMMPSRPVDANGFTAKSENAYLVRARSGEEASMSSPELKKAKARDEAERELAEKEGREPEVRDWQKVYIYKTGSGREQLTKAQAEERGLDPVKDRVRRQPVQTTRYLADWTDPGKYEQYRASWAERMNGALERAGCEERVDHRSYERQGVEQVPMRHEGPRVRGIERQEEERAREEEREPEPVTDIRRENLERSHLNEIMSHLRETMAHARAARDRASERVRVAVERARDGLERARQSLVRSLRRPEAAFAGQTRSVYRDQEDERRMHHHVSGAREMERERQAERERAKEREEQKQRGREHHGREREPIDRVRGGWSPERDDFGRGYDPPSRGMSR